MKASHYLAAVGGILLLGSLTSNLLHPSTLAPAPSALAPPPIVNTTLSLPPEQEARLQARATDIAARLSLTDKLNWNFYVGRGKNTLYGKQTRIADGLDRDGNFQIRIIFDDVTDEMRRVSCNPSNFSASGEAAVSPAARRDNAYAWLRQMGPQEAGNWQFVGFGTGNGPIYSTLWRSTSGEAYIASDARTGRLVTARFSAAPVARVAAL